MGISNGTSTGWLFVHYVQIELEFGNVGYHLTEKSGWVIQSHNGKRFASSV